MRVRCDKLLAILGAISGISLSIYLSLDNRSPILITTSILATLACVLYVIISMVQAKVRSSGYVDKKQLTLLLDVFFVLLLAGSIASYYLRCDEYTRPIYFFVLASLTAGILAAKISVSSLKGKQTCITLCQIIAVGLVLEWSVSLLYPTVIGLDPWWNRWYTLKIISDGGVEAIQQRLPLFHFIVAGTSLPTGLDYRLSTMISVSLSQVAVDAYLIYAVAKLAFSRRIALLAALLTTISCWHIWFGYWTTPNTLGATLALAIVYLVIRWHRDKQLRMLVGLCVVFCALLVTHPIATVWAVIGVGIYFLVVVTHNIVVSKKVHIPVRLLIAFVIVVGSMSLWWSTDTGYWGSVRMFVVGQFKPAIVGYTYSPVPTTPIIPATTTVADATPITSETSETSDIVDIEPILSPYDETWLTGSYWETVFNSSGMFLYFAISLTGCLCVIKSWRRQVRGTYLVAFGFFILCIGYFPMLFGMSVIEHRWWYFAQILMSIPLSLALFSLARMSSRVQIHVVVICSSVMLLTFLMAIGLPANMDNYTFSKNQLVRYALTQQEVDAVHDIRETFPDATIGTDSFYAMTIRHLIGYTALNDMWGAGQVKGLTNNFLSGDFTSVNTDLIVIREYVVEHPIGHGNGVVYRLNYDPRSVLIEQGFEKVYENSEVSVFQKLVLDKP